MCLNSISNPVSTEEQVNEKTAFATMQAIIAHAADIINEVCDGMNPEGSCSECPMQTFCIGKFKAARFWDIFKTEDTRINELIDDFYDLKEKIEYAESDASDLYDKLSDLNELARYFEEKLEEME